MTEDNFANCKKNSIILHPLLASDHSDLSFARIFWRPVVLSLKENFHKILWRLILEITAY